MRWVYRFDERALKELRNLGKQPQRDIVAYLDERIAGEGDPRHFGKGPKADLAGLWRYRVGDDRILFQIKDGELLVLLVAVGHRREVYGEGLPGSPLAPTPGQAAISVANSVPMPDAPGSFPLLLFHEIRTH